MKFFKFFWKRNRGLSLLFIITTAIFVSYEISAEMEEWFTGADIIYSLLSQLSLGFMGGFVFYAVQSEVAAYKSRIILMKILLSKLEHINTTMKRHINVLFQSFLKISYEDIDNKEEFFNELYSHLTPEEMLNIFDRNGNQKSVKTEQIEHRNYISSIISDLFTFLGSNLEEDIRQILNEIIDSEYFSSIQILEENKLSNQNVISEKPFHPTKRSIGRAAIILISTNHKTLYNYYLLTKKLDKYIEENC